MYIATHSMQTPLGSLVPGQMAPGAEAWPGLKTLVRMGRLLHVADGKERELVAALLRGEMPPASWAPGLREWDAAAIRRRMGQPTSSALVAAAQDAEPKRKRRKGG